MMVNDNLRFALKILFTGGLQTGAPFGFQTLKRYFDYLFKTGNFRFVGY
jgi:hypothetical protein